MVGEKHGNGDLPAVRGPVWPGLIEHGTAVRNRGEDAVVAAIGVGYFYFDVIAGRHAAFVDELPTVGRERNGRIHIGDELGDSAAVRGKQVQVLECGIVCVRTDDIEGIAIWGKGQAVEARTIGENLNIAV